MTERIDKYFRSEITEKQALQLWERLLVSDRDYFLFELFIFLIISRGQNK